MTIQIQRKRPLKENWEKSCKKKRKMSWKLEPCQVGYNYLFCFYNSVRMMMRYTTGYFRKVYWSLQVRVPHNILKYLSIERLLQKRSHQSIHPSNSQKKHILCFNFITNINMYIIILNVHTDPCFEDKSSFLTLKYRPVHFSKYSCMYIRVYVTDFLQIKWFINLFFLGKPKKKLFKGEKVLTTKKKITFLYFFLFCCNWGVGGEFFFAPGFSFIYNIKRSKAYSYVLRTMLHIQRVLNCFKWIGSFSQFLWSYFEGYIGITL